MPAAAFTAAITTQIDARRVATARQPAATRTAPRTRIRTITARSRQEPHLRRELRREGRDHRQVEEPRRGLHRARALASKGELDERGDEPRGADHPDGDPRGPARHREDQAEPAVPGPRAR